MKSIYKSVIRKLCWKSVRAYFGSSAAEDRQSCDAVSPPSLSRQRLLWKTEWQTKTWTKTKSSNKSTSDWTINRESLFETREQVSDASSQLKQNQDYGFAKIGHGFESGRPRIFLQRLRFESVQKSTSFENRFRYVEWLGFDSLKCKLANLWGVSRHELGLSCARCVFGNPSEAPNHSRYLFFFFFRCLGSCSALQQFPIININIVIDLRCVRILPLQDSNLHLPINCTN